MAKKARLTKSSLMVLEGPELRYIAAQANIAASAVEIFRMEPAHWAGLMSKDKTAQAKFLALDLGAESFKNGLRQESPAMRDVAYQYIVEIQRVLREEGPTLPSWADMVANYEGPPIENTEKAKMRGRRRGLRRSKPAEKKAETTEEAAPAEPKPSSKPAPAPAPVADEGSMESMLDTISEDQNKAALAIADLHAEVTSLSETVASLVEANMLLITLSFEQLELDQDALPTNIEELPTADRVFELIEEADAEKAAG